MKYEIAIIKGLQSNSYFILFYLYKRLIYLHLFIHIKKYKLLHTHACIDMYVYSHNQKHGHKYNVYLCISLSNVNMVTYIVQCMSKSVQPFTIHTENNSYLGERCFSPFQSFPLFPEEDLHTSK